MGVFKLVKLADPIYIATNGVAVAHTGSTATSGTFKFYEGNNITFTTNGNSLTIHGGAGVGGGIGLAAGTQTANTGTVNFANSNGITFGMSGSTRVTASYTVPTLTEYLFSNSNGVSFGTNGSTVTATVKTDYLTTARASTDAIGLNTAKTNVTWTVNSSGLSFDAGGYAGTTSGFAGNLISGSVTNNTAGINVSLNHPAWLTTAMQSNAATISNVRVSGGTTSNLLSALTFADSNGVSFGLNAGTMTATVKTDYLTTAMASNRGTDFVQANAAFAGTNASGTIASSGISVSVNPAAAGVGIEAGTRTATTAGNLRFETGNGITFGLNAVGGSVMTASHNAITTGRASNDAVGLNTALTAGPLAWTVNSSGISLNASSAAGTTSGFGGNLISGSMTHNTAGLNLSLNHPAWLTTAMQSNAATISNINISAGTTSTNASAFTFANSNGVSFGLGTGASAGSITATVKTDYLTTARASTDAIGLNTAQTNVTWTVNSSGLSFNAGGYAGTGTSATNASVTLNSNGLAISVGAGGGVTPVASASNGSFSFTTLGFSNANNVTFGTSAGSIITASVAAPGAAAENNWVNLLGANTAGNTTASGSTIGYSGINLTLSGTNNSVVNISAPATSSLSATGIVSISTNGSTISIGAALKTLSSYWEGIDRMTLLHAGANGNISVERFKVDQYVSASMIGIPLYQSISSSATGNTYGQQWSIYAMVLTNDTANSRLMSLSSSSTQTTYTVASNTAGVTQLNGSGIRPLTVPININMTPGVYYMAFNLSTNTFSSGTASTALNRTASFIGRAPIMSASFAMVSDYTVATGNTNNLLWPQGVVSGGASAGIPATISHSQITMTGLSHSQANLAFYMRA